MNTELIVVEGVSAADAVRRVVDRRFQTVLGIQGKPLNAEQATPAKIRSHPALRRLVDHWLDDGVDGLTPSPAAPADGAASHPRPTRFDRLALLFDPDPDGVHCGILFLRFVRRMLPDHLDGRIRWIRPPIYTLTFPDGHRLYPTTPGHLAAARTMAADARMRFTMRHHRGLASMDPDTLTTTCVDPATRREEVADRESVDRWLDAWTTG